MSKLPQVRPETVLKALQRAGWEVVRIHGSHHILAHPDRPAATIVVPVHRKPLKRGTLADIVKEAGLSLEEFQELL
jgi:predicted RNA binding protein YcfA (HicA-like mRNA interferase family)